MFTKLLLYIRARLNQTLHNTLTYLVENSTPIVDVDLKLNSFLVNLVSKLDLPTPESPIRTTLNEFIELV